MRIDATPTHAATLIRLSTAGLCLALASSCNAAASFDCKLAKGVTERAVCASPTLSVLDERVARSYARALHALSQEGAASLRESQRSWWRFITHACAPEGVGTSMESPGETMSRCLEAGYSERVGQLGQAGVRIGPYLFNRIDRFEAKPAPAGDESGSFRGIVILHIGYPQIDAPTTSAAVTWNTARQAIPDSSIDDEVDKGFGYELGCVGDRFISVETSTWEYPHGAPHGTWAHEIHNVVMTPESRDMTDSDIFMADSDWERKLPSMFWNVYLNKDRAVRNDPRVETAIRDRAADPGSWLLTPAGLQISFDAYEGGAYANNPGRLVLPWAALQPMLATAELSACKSTPLPAP